MESLPETIYVVSYRRSGTVWLANLLGDAMQCPVGGAVTYWDSTDVATYGLDRKSDCFVRRGHFKTSHNYRDNNGHVMACNYLKDSKIFFIVRDPRDVIVSSAHFWRVTVDSAMKWVCEGKSELERIGNWRNFVTSWLDCRLSAFFVSYEDLYRDPLPTFKKVLNHLELVLDDALLNEVIDRNDCRRRKMRILSGDIKNPKGKTFLIHHLTMSEVGRWKNFIMGSGTLAKLEVCFGDLLKYFNYDK